MKKIYILTILLLIFVVTQVLIAQSDKDFKVIINVNNKIDDLSKAKLDNIFMKKVTQWTDGTKIYPVNLNSRSFVRKAFSKSIHEKDIEAVQAYWRKQIFSGTNVPPLEKDSDAEIVKYVMENPGSIGYVSKNTDTQGTKVIKLIK